jgi:hypothetical protein
MTLEKSFHAGARVIVTREPAAPVEIAHPKLFVQRKPEEKSIRVADATRGDSPSGRSHQHCPPGCRSGKARGERRSSSRAQVHRSFTDRNSGQGGVDDVKLLATPLDPNTPLDP